MSLQYAITALAVVVMLAGVVRLARSPFVTGEDGHPPLTPAVALGGAGRQVCSGCTRAAIGSSSASQSAGSWSGTSTSLVIPTATYSLDPALERVEGTGHEVRGVDLAGAGREQGLRPDRAAVRASR